MKKPKHGTRRRMAQPTPQNLVDNPFVSRAQQRACYAKDDPDWDCHEWDQASKGKHLPERKATITNALVPTTSTLDPSNTTTLRRSLIAELRTSPLSHATDPVLWREYTICAYRVGVQRAVGSLQLPLLLQTGSNPGAGLVLAVVSSPETQERIMGLTRHYLGDVDNVMNLLQARMVSALTNGDRRNGIALARSMLGAIGHCVVVAAQAEGQVAGAKALGVTSIRRQWCGQCQPPHTSGYRGQVQTLDAYGQIPSHSWCTCAWQLQTPPTGNMDCGTGAGGFKSGNTCAKGGGSSKPSAGSLSSMLGMLGKAKVQEVAQAASEVKPLSGRTKAENQKLIQTQFLASIRSNTTLPAETKMKYAKTAQEVFAKMPAGALDRFQSNVKGYNFHANTRDLTSAVPGGDAWTKEGKVVGGAYDRASQKFHLDGDIKGGAAKEVYAHEFTHGVDGPNHDISKSLEWRTAFAHEIDKLHPSDPPKLSDYAATKHSEGLAEFGRLVYGTNISKESIEKKFPRCTEVFRKWGMWE